MFEPNILRILLSIVFYLAIPILVRVFIRTGIQLKRAIWLSISNTVVVFFIYAIVYINRGGFPNIVPAILWCVVSISILHTGYKVEKSNDQSCKNKTERLTRKESIIASALINLSKENLRLIPPSLFSSVLDPTADMEQGRLINDAVEAYYQQNALLCVSNAPQEIKKYVFYTQCGRTRYPIDKEEMIDLSEYKLLGAVFAVVYYGMTGRRARPSLCIALNHKHTDMVDKYVESLCVTK